MFGHFYDRIGKFERNYGLVFDENVLVPFNYVAQSIFVMRRLSWRNRDRPARGFEHRHEFTRNAPYVFLNYAVAIISQIVRSAALRTTNVDIPKIPSFFRPDFLVNCVAHENYSAFAWSARFPSVFFRPRYAPKHIIQPIRRASRIAKRLDERCHVGGAHSRIAALADWAKVFENCFAAFRVGNDVAALESGQTRQFGDLAYWTFSDRSFAELANPYCNLQHFRDRRSRDWVTGFVRRIRKFRGRLARSCENMLPPTVPDGVSFVHL
jgi:hypothetical protein